MDYKVCFSARDGIEISYHYEVLLVGKLLPLKVELTVHISYPTECFFLLRHYFIPQQAEFHHLCIVQDKSFQPALMQQVTCCIYT